MNSLANNVTNSFETVVYNNHTSFIQASHTMCKSIRCNLRWGVYTLKTPAGSNLIRKGSLGAKLHSGSTMTRKSVNLTRNMTQSWGHSDPILCQVCKELTKFRVTFDPELSYYPQRTLSRVTLTRVFLEYRRSMY